MHFKFASLKTIPTQMSDRPKFAQWSKKFQKMEDLEVEFELAVETDTKLKGFLQEVKEKLKNMEAFKKAFNKFSLTVENLLKSTVL